MVGHLSRQPLQLHHALRLQVLNRVIVGPVLRVERRPRHQDVLEDPQHQVGVVVQRRGGECDEKLKDSFPNLRILADD